MPFQPLRRLVLAAGLMATASLPAHALVFNLSFLPGTSADAMGAFQAAANTWSSLLADPVAVSLTIGTSSTLGSGVLASTFTNQVNFSYATVRAALIADATTATDAIVAAHLPPGPNVPLLINYTKDNPNGVGSPVPYLDITGANNSTIHVSSANARALGLVAAPALVTGCTVACDGYIAFSTAYTYDYDPSNGIAPGAFDLVGLAEHEIGHALGFISGVDVLDRNAPDAGTWYNADTFTFLSPLDLFRCSAATANSNVRDFTDSIAAKTFSIDGCQTADLGGQFSTGVVHGDGNQASHWKAGISAGIMDPNLSAGQGASITPLDLQAFDAIGWTPAAAPVAEPGSLGLLASGLLGLTLLGRRRFRRG